MSDAIELCDSLLKHGDLMMPDPVVTDNRLTNYDSASQLLIKLKTLNRFYYSKLDKQRLDVEKCKESVDKKRLHLENLLYEVEHWNREINVTKKLDTPQLSKLENDLNNSSSGDALTGVAGGANNSSEIMSLCQYGSLEGPSLEAKNDEYLTIIQKEKERREELREILNKKQLQQYKMSERLIKKRKFLEELPTRVSSINSIARTLQPHFEQIVDNFGSSSTSSG